jgi:tetratricopeptide (TPR) repeat protein
MSLYAYEKLLRQSPSRRRRAMRYVGPAVNLDRLLSAARAADASGQLALADRLCRAALEIDAACADALLLAGSIAARTGRNADAVALLRRAVAADPTSYDGTRWLAGLLLGKDGGGEAIALAKSAVRLLPDAESHALLGMAYLAAFRYGAAVQSFRDALAKDPGMAGAYHNLGVALQKNDQPEEAIEAFTRALELAPRQLASQLHLGQILLGRGDVDAAVACFDAALRINPNLASAKRLRMDAIYVAIRGEDGEKYIRQELADHPNSAFAHALLGSWLQEQGRFDDAAGSISQSLEIEPMQGFGYYVYAHNRRISEADRPLIGQMESVAGNEKLHPTDRRYVNFALGKAFDDLREYELAISRLDQANGEGAEEASSESSMAAEMYVERARATMRIFGCEQLLGNEGKALGSAQPLFIFGMPRSGTTLLEQILSRHSQVGAGGELRFWRDRRRRILDLSRETFDRDELVAAGHDYLDLLESIGPGKARVTDKFPSNYLNLGLLHEIFPNATFIHSKRHPVDTCLSIYMRPFFTLNEFGYSRRNIVDAYRMYEELMEHWRRVLPPGRFLEVEYEELVEDPERLTREILAHCRLNWEDACLHPEQGDRRVKTYSMWQVRQPVYKTSVARWRNYEPWLGVFRELM